MHTLALRLGKSVEEIGTLRYAEFFDWIAYFELHPGASHA